MAIVCGKGMLQMKKNIFVFLSLFLFLVSVPISSLAFANTQATSVRVLISATEYDYPPFSVTKGGEADGFSVELLRAVAREAGLSVSFYVNEWSVIKNRLENGELDVLPLVSYSEERDQYFDFTVPYIVMNGNIFVHEGNNDITSEDDLSGKSIAVMRNDTAHEYAMRMHLTDRMILTSTFQEAFTLLANGQCDAVLAQSLVGAKIIDDMGLTNIKVVHRMNDDGVSRIKVHLTGFEQKFCFAVRDGDKELLARLNEGLTVVSANGTYNQLYEKWFPFLINHQPTINDILAYLASILAPLLLFLFVAFFIMVKREVKRKTRELKAANEAKSRFLANMSHELRTPLNAILGYSALLQKEELLSKESVKSLQIINKSGSHLLSLINDILEIAKIESQKVSLNAAPFDFHQFIWDIEAMFAMEALAKGLTLEVKGLASVPRNLAGDALKLRMVLINLLGNALKFTQKGSVTLRLTAEEESDRHTRLHFQVEDTGIGISKQDQEKLFQAFSQTKSGLDLQEGTGLGLAISKEFVRLMGGNIGVKSTPNVGSTFSFTVELHKSEAGSSISKEWTGQVTGFRVDDGARPPLVMVAEDNEDSMLLLTTLLNGAGLQVLQAKDGKEAVDMASLHHPDFIWMDIRMPVMDGLQAARIIKQMMPDYSPVIVAISANLFEEEREAILESGCDDLVRKPCSEDELWSMMERHMKIEFIREQKTRPLKEAPLCPVREEDLRALEDALLRLDQEEMMNVVTRVRNSAPEAADYLMKQIESMQFTHLLHQLIDIRVVKP